MVKDCPLHIFSLLTAALTVYYLYTNYMWKTHPCQSLKYITFKSIMYIILYMSNKNHYCRPLFSKTVCFKPLSKSETAPPLRLQRWKSDLFIWGPPSINVSVNKFSLSQTLMWWQTRYLQHHLSFPKGNHLQVII